MLWKNQSLRERSPKLNSPVYLKIHYLLNIIEKISSSSKNFEVKAVINWQQLQKLLKNGEKLTKLYKSKHLFLSRSWFFQSKDPRHNSPIILKFVKNTKTDTFRVKLTIISKKIQLQQWVFLELLAGANSVFFALSSTVFSFGGLLWGFGIY